MIAAVFGIPGVGKSSVVRQVIEQNGFVRLYWGEMSLEVAKELGKADDIDQVRKMDIDEQQQLQFDVIKKMRQIIDQNPDQNYIIETHAVVKTPQGYLPGFNKALLQMVAPHHFVIMQAPAQNIFSRRQNDATRERKDDITLADIEQNLELTRTFATSYAVECNALLHIIENKEGDMNYAVGRLLEILGN